MASPALQKSDSDVRATKSQAENLTVEYDRLLGEHSVLLVRCTHAPTHMHLYSAFTSDVTHDFRVQPSLKMTEPLNIFTITIASFFSEVCVCVCTWHAYLFLYIHSKYLNTIFK